MLSACAVVTEKNEPAEPSFSELESSFGGRLGICAIDTASDRQICHRADERFPMCSTFKAVLAGAVLARDAGTGTFMQEHVRYTKKDLVNYSPVTKQHVSRGMTVAELCKAAIRHSDNTAANLLMKLLGGPPAVTAFARSIGDREFRLDRWETELNSAIPGDPRDTTTPAAMAGSLRSMVLGNVLPNLGKMQMRNWLCGHATGVKRIRAGAPADWLVGDKTGTGAYGTTNDIAVLWPPKHEPIVLAVFYTQQENAAMPKDEIIERASRVAIAGILQQQG